jgi:hypothetical protein
MYHMGLCHLNLGQWRETKDCLMKAVKLDKKSAVLKTDHVQSNLRIVELELKKQEQAANKAEAELLASLEAETSKSKKPSKKQKAKAKAADKAKKEKSSSTMIASCYRGFKARQTVAVLRIARNTANEKARLEAVQRARDEKREKAR